MADDSGMDPDATGMRGRAARQDGNLGPYEILEEIGRGGMGIVFKARHVNLGKIVALKTLLPGVVASEVDVGRFHQEAKAAAELAHPGIVQVHDVGEDDGVHYLAMDFVEGESLDKVIGEIPITPRRALEIVHQVANALAFAHSRGILHRDVKPANILLADPKEKFRIPDPEPERIGGENETRDPRWKTEDWIPMLTDFGLAKRVESSVHLTQSGATLGTPSYMAPEQAEGAEKVDARADVYSLGAVLYELLTLQPPFEGATPVNVLFQVLNKDPVPPSRIEARIHPEIETICLKCLEKSPERRYASASELAADIRRYLEGEPILSRPPGLMMRIIRRAKRNKAVSVGIGFLLLFLLFLCVFFFGPGSVSVRSTPPGAQVLLDGEETGWVTPVPSRIFWPPGSHTVGLRKEGFDFAEQKVDVRALSGKEIVFTLEKDHGFFELKCFPPDSQVRFIIDGRRREANRYLDGEGIDGGFSKREYRLRKGAHVVEVHRPRHETATKAIFIDPARRVRLETVLRHETGQLSVTCSEAGVILTARPLEGQLASIRADRPYRTFQVPADRFDLESGRWRLSFEKENCFPVHRDVQIDPGALSALNVTILPILHWSFQTGDEIQTTTCVVDVDKDGVFEVYATSMDGCIYGISGEEGSLLWKHQTDAPFLNTPSVADLDSDGRFEVVAVNERELFVLDALQGLLLWNLKMDAGSSLSKPCLFDVDKDGTKDVVLPKRNGKVVAISGASRGILWEFQGRKEIMSPPFLCKIDGDETPDIVVTATESCTFALSGASGEKIWEYGGDPGFFLGGPSVRDLDGDSVPEVVFGSVNGKVCCLSAKTGEFRWAFKTGKWVPSTAAFADLTGDGRLDVIIGSGDRHIYALDGTNGNLIWKYKTGFEVWAHVSCFDVNGDGVDDVFSGSDDSFVYAIDGKSGALMWRFRTGNQVISAVEIADIDGDGAIEGVFTSKDGKVYALKLKPDPSFLWIHKMRTGATVDRGVLDIDHDGHDEILVGGEDQLSLLSSLDGRELWRRDEKGVATGLLTRAFGEEEGACLVRVVNIREEVQISVLSAVTREILWTKEISGHEPVIDVLGRPGSDRDGQVIVSTAFGLYGGCIDVFSCADGKLTWRFERDDHMSYFPFVVDDMDRDGSHDLLVGPRVPSDRSSILVLSGRDGGILWERGVQGAVVEFGGDVDGDGTTDVLLRDKDGSAVMISGKKGDTLWRSEYRLSRAYAKGLGDIDGDGVPDFVYLGLGKDEDVVGLGSGKTGLAIWRFRGRVVAHIGVIADLDGDGLNDIAVQEKNGALCFRSGAGGKALWRRRVGHLSVFPTSIGGFRIHGVRDIDGDGSGDYIYSRYDGYLCAISGKRSSGPKGSIWSFSRGRRED